MVEKGKQPGSHLLSGAVLNPRSLQRLFAGRPVLEQLPSYGPVPDESVYVLTRRAALPIPTPPHDAQPGQRRHLVVPARPLVGPAGRRGRGHDAARNVGASVCSSQTDRSSGSAPATKGRGADGEELSNFEPGNDIVARLTVLAEGTQGHLTGVALEHFGLRPDNPQVWELGVKEVWRVSHPLDRVIHTMGWPLRPGAKYREFGGSFIYPMGADMLAIGMVVGLDYRDVSLSVHDLLAGAEDAPQDPRNARRRRAAGVGSQDHPWRGFLFPS